MWVSWTVFDLVIVVCKEREREAWSCMAMAIISWRPCFPPLHSQHRLLLLPATISLLPWRRPAAPLLASCRIGFDAPLSQPDLPNLQPLTVHQLKTSLTDALQGVNRGVFGVSNARKQLIEQLIESLEHVNPVPRPTEHLEKVNLQFSRQ